MYTMAQKKSKFMLSKGERLGWTPIDKVQKVTLASVVVRGRRVTKHVHAIAVSRDAATGRFLIP